MLAEDCLFWQRNMFNFVSRNLKHHNRYCLKARDNAWQIRWYTKYRSRKRKKKDSQKERICRHPQLGRKIITLCLKFFWHPIPTAFWRLWSWKNNWQNLVCQLITSTAQLMPWATFVACYFSLYFAATLPWATFVLQLFCPAFWTSHIRGQKCELLDGT